MGEMILAFVSTLLGLSLTPSVADSVVAAQGGNVTGVAATLVGLVTVFWVILVLAIPIVVVYSYFKSIQGD